LMEMGSYLVLGKSTIEFPRSRLIMEFSNSFKYQMKALQTHA
jgi:hypothetical protein